MENQNDKNVNTINSEEGDPYEMVPKSIPKSAIDADRDNSDPVVEAGKRCRADLAEEARRTDKGKRWAEDTNFTPSAEYYKGLPPLDTEPREGNNSKENDNVVHLKAVTDRNNPVDQEIAENSTRISTQTPSCVRTNVATSAQDGGK